MAIDKAANADTVKNCSVEIIKNTCKPQISSVINYDFPLRNIGSKSVSVQEAIEARCAEVQNERGTILFRSKDE